MTTKNELAVRNVCFDTRGFYPGWVKGEIGEYRFSAKVFDRPSKYGVHGGRVSKLSVYDQKKQEAGADFFSACIVNYDRGWDIRPKTREERAILKEVLAYLERLPVAEEAVK